jgi:hypothetical protein
MGLLSRGMMVRLGNGNVKAEKPASRRSEAYHPAQRIMADMILAPYLITLYLGGPDTGWKLRISFLVKSAISATLFSKSECKLKMSITT